MFDDLAPTPQPVDDGPLRKRAIKRLKNRHDFYGHVLLYSMVNAFITLIWLLGDRQGFFWPVFPIVGWGIAVVLNAWNVYRDDEFDDEQIRREIARMQHRA
jgi:2TM domain